MDRASYRQQQNQLGAFDYLDGFMRFRSNTARSQTSTASSSAQSQTTNANTKQKKAKSFRRRQTARSTITEVRSFGNDRNMLHEASQQVSSITETDIVPSSTEPCHQQAIAPATTISGEDEATEDDSENCSICLANRRCCACLPCGHRSTCIGCSNELMKSSNEKKLQCPVCRQATERIVRIY
jgi:hypothetical protein